MLDTNIRVPPQSAQAEQAVLGGLLLDNSSWSRVQGVVSTDDFYFRDNQILFNAISLLLNENKPADMLTVFDYLESKGLDESAGGLGYLAGLCKETPSASNVGAYAAIVQEKSLLRQLVSVASVISDAAFAGDTPAKEIVSKAESLVFEIGERGLRGKKGFSRLRDIFRNVINIMEANVEKPQDSVLGLPTGFRDIDAFTSGLQKGDLVVVAGRPSMGKTAFSMNIAEYVAINESKPVAVFSMEMQNEQLGMRVLSGQSGVGLKQVRQSWEIDDSGWPLITAAITRSQSAPLFVDDTPALSVSDIRTRAMRLIHQHGDEFGGGLGMILIDYIQLMSADQARHENRNGQIEEITRGLKRLAKELDIPIVALSQLNRSLENRPNKRPVMPDLRESGAIEQDADVIAFLYRDEVYNSDTLEPGVAEVIFAKQRQGQIGTVKLIFEGKNTRFRDLSTYKDY